MPGRGGCLGTIVAGCCCHVVCGTSSSGNTVLASGVKVLREGGETAMPAQILHVTNQGQSVRQRVKEGMKGRRVGLPANPLPVSVWG